MLHRFNCYRHTCFINMINFIDCLIAKAVLSFKSKNSNKKFQEPDYTAAIIKEFVPLANQYLMPLRGMKIGGSYIHQKPYVSFVYNGKVKKCELGDLLVICRKRVDSEDLFNAVLMQLKMSSGRDVKRISNTGDLIQLYLYTKWPLFWFNNNTKYDIQPKTVSLGAQYLFVNNNKKTVFTHSIPQIQMQIDDSFSFGRFLFDFINWQNGRPMMPEDQICGDEWSKLIWGIIDHNKKAVFRRKNINIYNEPRNSIDFLTSLCSQDNNDFTGDEYTDNPANKSSEEYVMACPILFIDLAYDSQHIVG